MKRTINFKKFILFLSVTMIITVFLFQCLNYFRYIQSNDLSTIAGFNSSKLKDIMYYTKNSKEVDINQIIETTANDFSYEKNQIQTLNENTWIKGKLSRSDDENIIFLDYPFLDIDSAYVCVDEKWLKVESSQNFIYSYIKLPDGFYTDKYILMKLENLNTNLNFNLQFAIGYRKQFLSFAKSKTDFSTIKHWRDIFHVDV